MRVGTLIGSPVAPLRLKASRLKTRVVEAYAILQRFARDQVDECEALIRVETKLGTLDTVIVAESREGDLLDLNLLEDTPNPGSIIV